MTIQRILVAVTLFASATVHAGVGDLTPVRCDIKGALEVRQFYTSGRGTKPNADAGTVHPKATVLTARSGELTVHLAIDSADAKAPSPDLVRFDFAGKGKFNDRDVAPLKSTSARTSYYQATFGPAVIPVQRGGRAIPVTVQGVYYRTSSYRRAQFTLVAGVEGKCAFGEKTFAVRIVDGNGNIAFGDKATAQRSGRRVVGYVMGDTLAVDTGDGTFTKSVRKCMFGQPVLVDGSWYQVTVSAGASKVRARPLELKTGKLRIAHDHWSCVLVRGNEAVHLSGGREPVSLPAGPYTVVSYTEYTGEASQAPRGALSSGRTAGYSGRSKTCQIAAEKVTELVIGSPMTASVVTSQSGRDLRFNLHLVDAAGVQVDSIYLPGRRIPPPPKVKILNVAGKQIYAATLEYG